MSGASGRAKNSPAIFAEHENRTRALAQNRSARCGNQESTRKSRSVGRQADSASAQRALSETPGSPRPRLERARLFLLDESTSKVSGTTMWHDAERRTTLDFAAQTIDNERHSGR